MTVTRRLVLAGGLGGATLAVAACDPIDDLLGGDDGPGVSGAVTPTAPPADTDSALVEDVLAVISTAAALARATGAAVPGLAKAAARLARLHDAHAAELGGTVGSPAAPAVAADRTVARADLLAAESDLQQELVAAARRAHSGALAQVLAAMAAAVAQQRVMLA